MEDIKIYNNFVDDNDCKIMIEKIEELQASGESISYEDGRTILSNSDDPVFVNMVDKYLNKTIKISQNNFTKYNGYIATKYVENAFMATHVDSDEDAEVGALMYLNDDYEGGELTYTDSDGIDHMFKPKQGDMVYFPSWYKHGVNKVIKGTRYFFTISILKD